MADLKNTMIGGFRILAEIKGASGSQGQVFKAVCEHPPFAGIEPGTVVALKAMAVHDEDGQAWAKLEKRTSELVRLSHPNVVKYYGCFSESGTFNDIHAIVQEFLDGETLKQRLLRCPSGLDADEALHVTEAALAGLEYTAANGIVHRDVKPGNIFLCTDGRVKLIDFEVAHQEGGTTTSASGNLVGSFDYMAPDFTNSTFRGDERSDVFSMGVVMHEAITGRTPYQRIEGGDNQANFAFLSRWARLQIDGTNPIRISSRANRLLAHSEEVLTKALAPLPENRYASFAEFHAGLKSIRYRDLRNGEMAYRILQIVGKGGFGEVFKARLKRSNQLVAIKHLLKAAYAERFYREAKIMSQLHDSCFVQFRDFFVVEHAGNREAFLVMDFLPGMPGSSLRDAIKRAGGAALPFHETLLAFARFAHGLSVIHSRGIFHRDIKPSNLYYPEGQPGRAAIMDLGIARNIHGTATTGQVPGTLDYMPPEVVLTDNRGDSGMDIYALGLCLYEALSGKTAYPRLPQGAAALTAFFTRAKIKAMPDLSDPAVVENAPLHELLVQMTHPDSAERIVDTQEVERRLTELAEAAGVGVNLSDASPDGEEEETSPGTVTFTIPSMDETDPDAPEENGHDTTGTVATDGTLATDTAGEGGGAALEKEIKRIRLKRHVRNLSITAAVVAVACGATWLFRGRLAEWFKPHATDPAVRSEIVRAEEKTRLDEAAEDASAEVVSAYMNAKAQTTACDELFSAWRAEWKSRSSPAKFDELEKRIAKAQTDGAYIRFRKTVTTLENGYRNQHVPVEATDKQAEEWRSVKKRPAGFPDAEFKKLDERVKMARATRIRRNDVLAADSERGHVVNQYEGGTVADFDAGDVKAKAWLKKWKGNLPPDESKKMKSKIADARDKCKRMLAGDAQKSLQTVLAAYADPKKKIAVGNKLADDWRNEWKARVTEADYARMDAQLVSARTKREEQDRMKRRKIKEEKCASECQKLVADYKNDASDKKDTDNRYAKWEKNWKDDGDLAKDWFAARAREVTDEKRLREERDSKAKEKDREVANAEFEDVLRSYDNTEKSLEVIEKDAQAWCAKWQGKLDAAVFGDFESRLVSARQKRANHDEWIKNQRALADATNKVESVRIGLADDYRNLNVSARDADKRKSAIDDSFERWSKQWENNGFLQKSLPGWFAGRKKTVEDAKSECEVRIAETRRIQFVAAKTNEVAKVRGQLVNGYRDDASDKLKLDKDFTDWMLKWSADSDLPSGYFSSQREIIDKEKIAREKRDEERMARDEAEQVCETYRQDGVPMGDGSRKSWIRTWTNRLDAAMFQKLLQEINKARQAVLPPPQPPKPVVAPLVAKTNGVATACTSLVNAYQNKAVRKTDTDKRYAEALREWVSDGELKDVAVRSWLDGQKRIVDDAKKLREQDIAKKKSDVEKGRKQLEDGYKADKPEKELDGAYAKWVQEWSADVDLPQDWLVKQSGLIEQAKKERERRDEVKRLRQEASTAADTVCNIYRTDGLESGNGSRKMWMNTWTNKLDGATFRELLRKIDEVRRSVTPSTPLPDNGLVAKTNQVVAVCAGLAKEYGNDAISKDDIGKRADQVFEGWGRDEVFKKEPLKSWFAEQRQKVERAKSARERRDAERARAREQAKVVIDSYQRGLDAGDARRDKWVSDWKDVLDATVFDEVTQMIDAARKDRVWVENEQNARKEADEVCKEYDASGVEAGNAKRKKWEEKWTNKLGRAVFNNLSDSIRIARDVAEKNRKAAWDDVTRVRTAYESDVEAGDAERQLWDGKWKSVLGEKDYAEISGIIDKARAKAEAEQLEKGVRAMLKVDKDSVDQWRKRLEQAEKKITDGKSRGVLDEQKATELLNEINLRKKWVVGVVVNQSQYEIEVARRPIKPGQREFFEFRGTMPVDGLRVASAGYKPLTIDERSLDGSVVQIGVGKWKLEPIPKAWVLIPQLEDGVTCHLDGAIRRSGEKVEVDSVKDHECEFSRKNHKSQKYSFRVKGGEHKKLQSPKGWEEDPEFKKRCEAMLADAWLGLDSGFGMVCLETYYKMHSEGYKLKQSDYEIDVEGERKTFNDIANVEAAWEICNNIYQEALKTGGRYRLEEAERAWKKARRLYNVLMGKPVTEEEPLKRREE